VKSSGLWLPLPWQYFADREKVISYAAQIDELMKFTCAIFKKRGLPAKTTHGFGRRLAIPFIQVKVMVMDDTQLVLGDRLTF
jgi:hypothetical protein